MAVSVYLLLVCLLARGWALAADEPARVEVTDDARVTIVGRAPSLRAAVEEIAWRTGLRLVAYDAADREVSTRIEQRALEDALHTLLRGESYVLGVERGRVAWLHVLGDGESGHARRSAGQAPAPPGFAVPPALTREAFGSDDPAARAAAFGAITEQVLHTPERRQAFLATDAGAIAETLRRYPHAAEMLRQTGAALADAELQAKLREVLGAIEGPPPPKRSRHPDRLND
jgi:hypothetical protein